MLALWCGLAFVSPVSAREGTLPHSLSAAIIVKVLAFESSDRSEETMRIHVLDEGKLADELIAYVGTSIRDRSLVGVTRGLEIPEGVQVVVAVKAGNLDRAIEYARVNKALSVTTNPELKSQGAALIVYDDEGLPGILLNREASGREGLYWEPEILQIARMVGER